MKKQYILFISIGVPVVIILGLGFYALVLPLLTPGTTSLANGDQQRAANRDAQLARRTSIPSGWNVYTHLFGDHDTGTQFVFAYPPQATSIRFPSDVDLANHVDDMPTWYFTVGDRNYMVSYQQAAAVEAANVRAEIEHQAGTAFIDVRSSEETVLQGAYLYWPKFSAMTTLATPNIFITISAQVPDPEAGLESSGMKNAPDKDAIQVLLEHSIQLNGLTILSPQS